MGKLRAAVAVVWTVGALSSGRAAANWPQFRGPGGDGHCETKTLPLTWSETENVTWKVPIHDHGWSSPVIWEHQIWMTTATRDGKQLFAVCVDREAGKIVHDLKVFDVDKPETLIEENSYASPTPVIEASRVYVHFGTYGTACLDTETGKIIWARRDFHCDHQWGPGASPIPCGNLLIFQMDGIDVQYVVALEKSTGKTVWKTNRSTDFQGAHVTQRKAYCTPTVVRAGGRLQLISPGPKAVMAYDPMSGKELWKIRYRGWGIVPRPLFGHGLVFLTIDHDHPELWAVRPDGSGDVTDSHVVWRVRKGAPSVPSFLLVGDLIYAVSDHGIASCIEATSGQILWTQRVGGRYWASPILAAGRIYFIRFDGLTTVIEPGRQYRPLAENRLDGRIKASPAAAAGALFLRTETHLYRIE
ncbi:MAG: outer membrane protein assembly factor BamB family protein [Planctomycetota bacterium]